MKEIFNRYRFLVFAVAFFVISYILESYISGYSEADVIDTGRIEQALHEKESHVESIMESIMDDVRSGKGIVRSGSIFQMDRDFGQLDDQGISVFVFEGDSIRYWAGHSVSPEKLPGKNSPHNIILHIDDTWYDARYIRDGDYLCIGLILLQYGDEFNKNWFCNDFLHDFVRDGNFDFTIQPVYASMHVKNKDGSYIFSLVPCSNAETDGQKYNVVFFPFLLGIIMLLLYVDTVVESLAKRPESGMSVLFIMIGVIFVRVFSYLLAFPGIVYMLDFFDSQFFNGQGLGATFGDYFLNVVIIFFLVRYAFVWADGAHLRDRVGALPMAGKVSVWAAMLVAFALGMGYLFGIAARMVEYCDFSLMFNHLTSLRIYSFSGMLIFLTLIALSIYVAMMLASYFDFTLVGNLPRAILAYMLASAALSLLVWALAGWLYGAVVLYVLLMVGGALYMRHRMEVGDIYRYIFMLAVGALFVSAVICRSTQEKSYRICQERVLESSGVGDPIAELMLAGISEDLPKDAAIVDYLIRLDSIGDSPIYEYLRRHYYNGYWKHYNIDVKAVRLENGQMLSDIDDDFIREKYANGIDFGNENFRLVENPDGTIGYYAPIRYTYQKDVYYILLSFNSNPAPNKLGYPSILIDDKLKYSDIGSRDCAIYHNGHKVSNSGDYNYDMSDRVFLEGYRTAIGNDSVRTMVIGDFIHSVYRSGENTIVFSKQGVTGMDYIIQVAYMFVILVVVMLLLIGVKKLLKQEVRNDFRPLKTRLIISVSAVVFFSFFVVCGCMIYFNIRNYEQQDDNRLTEKINGVYMRMQQDCRDTARFHCKWQSPVFSPMDEYVVDLSHVFFTDINLYNPDGSLIACSRSEVFGRGIVGTHMNSEALKTFVVDSKSLLLHEEKIGKLKYVSAYMPFYNKSDELTAYINLAYFSRYDDFQRELWTQIVYMVNFGMVLMVLAIFVTVFVSDGIVSPLKMVQDKMVAMELGKNHEKIDYIRNDEIGQLVSEYNTMVDKLSDSAKALASSEREGAWKTMARQVAHEIKNPLTPMQLNTQFLKRAWDDQKPDFGDRLAKFTDTMIQQIETLSSIATSFSNFAKMPQPVARPLNVVEILDNVVQLYQNDDNFDLTSDLGGNKEVICMLDKEQITRVFVNIIRNATQAIPKGVKGKIHVSLENMVDKVAIRIADNGTGIPDEIREKLFTPNFTTKSAGSGLGLAMVKTMVENVKGTITFESTVGVGTTFIVTLPVGEEESAAVS